MIYNWLNYRKRYGKNYNTYKKKIAEANLTIEELKNKQNDELTKFIKYAHKNSKYYNDLYDYTVIENFDGIKDLHKLPILDKEALRENILDVYTISKNKGIISKTGGTTGKSLEVVYTEDDMQLRFAHLDNFRAEYGYELGKRTAWFSGKKILNSRNVKNNIFWKYDFIHKVRYYSTFHCSGRNLGHILKDLEKFNPEYIVGFPSNLYDIADYGIRNNLPYKRALKAIFPTAETVTNEVRKQIETFFRSKIYDQYASSEGAPFIFECKNGNLHLELRSGVFEVLNKNNEPDNKKGRLVVTSFSTHGTPLIRYDIGDELELFDEPILCNCGNNNPVVKKIHGRISDFIYSPYTGKINLGNISNSTKGVKGLIRFQVVQNIETRVEIFMVIDKKTYNEKSKKVFLQNLHDRFGEEMIIHINYTDEIKKEASGKYRLIKNNIKNIGHA